MARRSSHSRSFHWYWLVNTTDAFAGAISAANATGSAFSRQTPSRPRMANLYRVPVPMPGTNSSHTPVEPSARIGVPAPVQ